MAIKDNGGRIADAAQRASRTTKEDLYQGRVTDADLAHCDGYRLEDRDEWNMAKVSRRGKWTSEDVP